MILVSGASGQLGSLVLSHLRELGVDAIGGSRTPGPDGRLLDFDDPASLDFRGITTLVLVSAGYAEDDVVITRHSNVVGAAKRDGVGRVVYTSVVTQGDHLGFALAHRATEHLLRQSGLNWTILRNGLYAELVGGLLMWENDAIVSPFGAGAAAAATRADLATAAAIVAAHPTRHSHRVYDLTGPSFTVADIAAQLDAPIYELSLAQYRDRLLAAPGLLPFQPPMLASIATAIRHGFLATNSPDLAQLLGNAPKEGLAVACSTAAQNRFS